MIECIYRADRRAVRMPADHAARWQMGCPERLLGPADGDVGQPAAGPPQPQETPAPAKPVDPAKAKARELYERLPWYRRNEPNLIACLVYVFLLIFSGYFGYPGEFLHTLGKVLMVLAFAAVAAVWVNLRSGSIYFREMDVENEGRLKTWKPGTRTVTTILACLFLIRIWLWMREAQGW